VKDALKQRLVGAVVLAAIGVIFLPGFFKEQQGYQVDTESQIPLTPSVPEVSFETPEQNPEIQPAPAPDTMFLPPEPEPVAIQSSSSSSSPVANTRDVDTVPALPLGADGIPEAWVVQVASLGNTAAANKLRDELQAEGHKAYVRSVNTANGSVTRVFIGPKLDKAEALAVKTEVDKRLKVNSLVLRFQP
jgi:DedD protein